MLRSRSFSRSLRRSTVVAAGAFVLAACGSGSDGSESDEPDVDVAVTAVAASDESSADDAEGDDEFELPANIWPAEVDDPVTEEEDGEFVLPPNIWPAEVDDPAPKSVVTRSPDAEGAGVVPEGFSTVTARVTSADGEVCEVCLWLADSSGERSTGLMGVTDLGDPVGMAFVWDEVTDGRFFMLNTPTPLSIAWFDESGAHVSETDMEPCLTDDSAECERFSADGSYSLAVEMFQGQLGVVGIGPGSTIELLPGSESPTCQV